MVIVRPASSVWEEVERAKLPPPEDETLEDEEDEVTLVRPDARDDDRATMEPRLRLTLASPESPGGMTAGTCRPSSRIRTTVQRASVAVGAGPLAPAAAAKARPARMADR